MSNDRSAACRSQNQLMLVAALEAALRFDAPGSLRLHLRPKADRIGRASVVDSDVDDDLTVANRPRRNESRGERILLGMPRELVLCRSREFPKTGGCDLEMQRRRDGLILRRLARELHDM